MPILRHLFKAVCTTDDRAQRDKLQVEFPVYPGSGRIAETRPEHDVAQQMQFASIYPWVGQRLELFDEIPIHPTTLRLLLISF
jgi:hypothetical protein